MKRMLGVVLVLGAMVIAGCYACSGYSVFGNGKTIKGSGIVESEVRDVAGFDKIDLSLCASVTVSGAETFSCSVSADDNILPVIRTKVSGRTLHISTTESFSSRNPIEIKLEVPVIVSVSTNGSGGISLDNVFGESLSASLNGSGRVFARGEVKRLKLDATGSGKLEFAELQASDVKVSFTGSGTAMVWVADSLDASLQGSAVIKAKGSGARLKGDILGAGKMLFSEFEVEKAVMGINGSGRADLSVTESLIVEILGSGQATYKGAPPELETSVTGSGKVFSRN